MTWAYVAVCVCFTSYAVTDAISVFPRIAGSILDKNGIGYSFQVMVQTVKRLFFVTYPPLLGIMAINGGLKELFQVIAACYVIGSLGVLCVILTRKFFLSFFCSMIERFSQGGSLAGSFFEAFGDAKNFTAQVEVQLAKQTGSRLRSISFNIMPKIFFLALWILFFINTSVFIINIASQLFPAYSSVILQMSGFVTGIGSIALAFLLDPIVSRNYELKQDMDRILISLFWAHSVNLIILSPLTFFILWLVVL